MEFELAKQKAIKFIGISKKTENEVRLKLRNANCSNEIIEKVIDYIKGLGYINDIEYVDAYIRQNMRLLKYSIYEINQKLLQKGINKDIIEQALDKIDTIDYENKVIQKICSNANRFSDSLKLKNYLYRRGFNNIEID